MAREHGVVLSGCTEGCYGVQRVIMGVLRVIMGYKGFLWASEGYYGMQRVNMG